MIYAKSINLKDYGLFNQQQEVPFPFARECQAKNLQKIFKELATDTGK
jgi:hypothetical protein